MRSPDVEPGMKGYGLTVFAGTQVERFEIVVRGVSRNNSAGRDMIVIEAFHPELEGVGILAGMSGSPVFINEKLVGAVAYGWGDVVRAIGGVQPIEYMLDVLDDVTVEPRPPKDIAPGRSTWPVGESAAAASRAAQQILEIPAVEMQQWGLSDDSATFRPIRTPLLVGSDMPEVLASVKDLFPDASGFRPVMAGSAGSREAMYGDPGKAPLENGCAVGVSLVEGDLFLSAVGTATWVEPDRVAAFGHPMFGEGNVDMPFSLARVISVVPSQFDPFKLGQMIQPAGALRQDRFPAIGATRLVSPEMIPLNVTVVSEDTNKSEDYTYRIWPNRDFLPGLARTCVNGAIGTGAKNSGIISGEIEYEIELKNGEQIRKRQFLSGGGFVPFALANGITADLTALVANAHIEIPVKALRAKVRLGGERQSLAMESLRLSTREVEPGKVVRGTVRLERWRADPVERTFAVRIPDSLPDGTYRLVVADNGSRAGLERAFTPRRREARTERDIIARVREYFPANSWWVMLVDPAGRPVLEDSDLAGLPRTVEGTTSATNPLAGRLRTVEQTLVLEQRRDESVQIIGNMAQDVRVVRSRTTVTRDPLNF